MSITLELSEEERTYLEHAAAAAGSDVVSYIRQRVFSPIPSANAIDDDLAFLRRQAQTAIHTAQQSLLAQGIGYVYARDGNVVRHCPDGAEEILSSLASA